MKGKEARMLSRFLSREISGCHLLVVQIWESHLVFLFLSFFLCNFMIYLKHREIERTKSIKACMKY